MSPAIRTEKDPGLRADALGLVESVIMGVAGSGPAYSVAVSTATLIAAVGVLAPASLRLTRFGGHPESLARGAADAKNTSTIFAGVSPTDGRPRPCWT
jgi:hypothetical protein